MFSTDQNIDRIVDFIEESKVWLKLQSDNARLTVVDKVVRIITALVLVVVLFVIAMLVLTFLSFAAAIALGELVDSIPVGFLFVTAVYVILFVVVILKRHAWIERPLVRLLVNILVEDNGDGWEIPASERKEAQK